MKNNNVLHTTNKNEELCSPEIHFEYDKEKKIKQEKETDREEYSSILKRIFLPNEKVIDFKKDLIQSVTMGFFLISSIINIILNKDLIGFLTSLILIYITILINSNVSTLENNRYIDVAIWNLYNSTKMIVKGTASSFVENYSYTKFVLLSSIFCISTFVIGIVPQFNSLSVISLPLLIISYIHCFYHKDINTIKDSLKSVDLILPITLILSSIIGPILFGLNSINMTGYLVWLIIHSINTILKDYTFTEI